MLKRLSDYFMIPLKGVFVFYYFFAIPMELSARLASMYDNVPRDSFDFTVHQSIIFIAISFFTALSAIVAHKVYTGIKEFIKDFIKDFREIRR